MCRDFDLRDRFDQGTLPRALISDDGYDLHEPDYDRSQLYDYIGLRASLISLYHYGTIRLPDPMAPKIQLLKVL
jgi:hypothetical protein